MSNGKLIVISGASGVGKGTVLGLMMQKREDLFFSVSATTRAPRPGEVDGVHYFFISRECFEEMIANEEFLEYDAHADNYYGTLRGQAEAMQKKGHCLLDIEPKGADQVRKAAPDATLIFIMPPSMEDWNAVSGAGAIPRKSRSPCVWSGRSGKWSSGIGTTMWWSMTTPKDAPTKF